MPDQLSHPSPAEVALDLLPEASQRLVRSVDDLAESAWPGPSLLPGWTRGHVVAHLALNAEALAGVLRGVGRGEAVAMYPSNDSRDDAIAELAGASTADLRARLLASVTSLADAMVLVPTDAWASTFERTPGGPTFPATGIPQMRLREVEVHHVDLATAYTPEQWSAAFAAQLVDAMVARLDAAPGDAGTGFEVEAADLGRRWTVRGGGPVVSGAAARLGWWLSGRGTGEGLTSEGELPRVGEL